MRLQVRQFAFKPTFLFLLYLTYTLGALAFAFVFLFGDDGILKEALYSLLGFIVGAPLSIGIGLKLLNLFMKILPWEITIIADNTDEHGNKIATQRIVNTIRRERGDSPKQKPPRRPASVALETESEAYRISHGFSGDTDKLYGQQQEDEVLSEKLDKRRSSDEYKAVTDKQKKADPKVESSAEYKAITDVQLKEHQEGNGTAKSPSDEYKADTDKKLKENNKVSSEEFKATTDRVEDEKEPKEVREPTPTDERIARAQKHLP